MFQRVKRVLMDFVGYYCAGVFFGGTLDFCPFGLKGIYH